MAASKVSKIKADDPPLRCNGLLFAFVHLCHGATKVRQHLIVRLDLVEERDRIRGQEFCNRLRESSSHIRFVFAVETLSVHSNSRLPEFSPYVQGIAEVIRKSSIEIVLQSWRSRENMYIVPCTASPRIGHDNVIHVGIDLPHKGASTRCFARESIIAKDGAEELTREPIKLLVRQGLHVFGK